MLLLLIYPLESEVAITNCPRVCEYPEFTKVDTLIMNLVPTGIVVAVDASTIEAMLPEFDIVPIVTADDDPERKTALE